MSELDHLKYEGSKVPYIIKWLWILGVLGLMYYFCTYALPDLKLWLNRG